MSEGQGEGGTPAPPRGGYAPSPRPTFDRPALIRHRDATRHVWGDDDYFMGRSMDVFISKLRKYLKEDPSVQIVNYHGVGFKLEM